VPGLLRGTLDEAEQAMERRLAQTTLRALQAQLAEA
jgi:hypothetical protein